MAMPTYSGETASLPSRRGGVIEAHRAFIRRVPNYDQTIWRPEDALRHGSGNDMAQLLFVAGSLLTRGIVTQNDLIIQLSESHGRQSTEPRLDAPHTIYGRAALVIPDGVLLQLHCAFRGSALDNVGLSLTRPSAEEVITGGDVFGLEHGMHQYAHKLGISDEAIPTIDQLVALHSSELALTPDRDRVVFDEEF